MMASALHIRVFNKWLCRWRTVIDTFLSYFSLFGCHKMKYPNMKPKLTLSYLDAAPGFTYCFCNMGVFCVIFYNNIVSHSA